MADYFAYRLMELKKTNRGIYYTCSCTCGKTGVIVKGSSLKSGKTKSCGCLHSDVNRLVHSIDISGNRYGRLVAVSFSHRKNKNTYWYVRCDCGTFKQVSYAHLVGGRTKSCGCIKREMLQERSGENNHLWRGGTSTIYPKIWNNQLKENIRNRDQRRCQFPDCEYEDSLGTNKRLDVHHIDGNKLDCREENLISLCHPHHMAVEKSPKSWENTFYTILGDYYG